MATQNLFEKYGIKEVADVTFYRIEKKEETYESQRKISAGTILKGALELRTVYPIEKGVGSDEGFDAYVFTDAELITGTNYDCDDELTLTKVYEGTFKTKTRITECYLKNQTFPTALGTGVEQYDLDEPVIYNASTNTEIAKIVLDEYYTINDTAMKANIKYSDETYEDVAVEGDSLSEENETERIYTYSVEIITHGSTAVNSTDAEKGIYNKNANSPDSPREIGTHEYSYPQQVLMLFAKRQNLITKSGVRYQFSNSDTIFGGIGFNDNFAAAPNSTERVVVAGIEGSFTENTYDIQEINEVIKKLTETFDAKAYDVTYCDYAELVVEDEMGYFNPYFLGNDYIKASNIIVPFVQDASAGTIKEPYIQWALQNKGVDKAIATATMWGKDEHYSINDAIDALRQKKKSLDVGEGKGLSGVNSVYGGYKVTDSADTNGIPKYGKEDTDAEYNAKYAYSANGETLEVTAPFDKYPLENVLDALSEISHQEAAIAQDIKVTYSPTKGKSNRAIYVKTDGALDIAAGAYIYLLHNKNYRRLATDEDGIFSFEDKQGNTLYYQDKVFKGVEWLALVIIGDKGLIFVVNRHGKRSIDRVAWMVNENGYVTDSRTKALIRNGLIHTTDITVNNETFEATCTVKGLKVHKTTKKTNHYIPVLFLDTLKVTTLEQTAEEVYATGGHGNADLVGWDYGKEITLSIEDALFTPASMSAMFGSYENGEFKKGVKDVKTIDRMEKVIAKRNFIVPAGNTNGTPTEADRTAQAVFYDPATMTPYPDGTPIAEGEVFYKFTRSVAYEGQTIGSMIEISADKFPGTYKVVGDTYVRSSDTGKDQRFQFIIPQCKMSTEQTITLEADGDPSVFDMNMTVLRPEDGVMVRFIQYDVIENEEENDGSTMVKDTENLNLLDEAELFKVSTESIEDKEFIGATEY